MNNFCTFIEQNERYYGHLRSCNFIAVLIIIIKVPEQGHKIPFTRLRKKTKPEYLPWLTLITPKEKKKKLNLQIKIFV